jgi:hypothetical protein
MVTAVVIPEGINNTDPSWALHGCQLGLIMSVYKHLQDSVWSRAAFLHLDRLISYLQDTGTGSGINGSRYRSWDIVGSFRAGSEIIETGCESDSGGYGRSGPRPGNWTDQITVGYRLQSCPGFH